MRLPKPSYFSHATTAATSPEPSSLLMADLHKCKPVHRRGWPQRPAERRSLQRLQERWRRQVGRQISSGKISVTLSAVRCYGNYFGQTRTKMGLSKQGIGRHMEIRGWDERYRSGEQAAEDLNASPTPLLVAA